MLDFLYHKRLREDLETWTAKGWLSPAAASHILASLETGDGRSRIPLALAGIGALCIALALAAFIAANWDGIPRSVKLSGITAVVLAAHMLSAWTASRGHKALADIATGFATLVFVGGIALVGQIFHLPSDWAGGALIVTLGALSAAWIAGSRSSLVIAAIAAIVWQTTRPELSPAFTLNGLIGMAIAVAVLLHPLAYPHRLGRWAALSLLLVTFGRWLADTSLASYHNDDTTFAIAALGFSGLAAIMIQIGQLADLFVKWSSSYPKRAEGHWLMMGAAQGLGFAILSLSLTLQLILASYLSTAPLLAAVTKIPVALPLGAALLLAAAGFLLAFQTPKSRWLFAVVLLVLGAQILGFAFTSILLVAILSLCGLIAISLIGTYYNVALWTLCGYGGLTVVVLYLLEETIGSLLGQSLFFLVAGVVLLLLALGGTRLLRRGETKKPSTQREIAS